MFDLANRTFVLVENAQGHAAADTTMVFSGERFPWRATYTGPNIKHGQVLVSLNGDELHMTYHACDGDGLLHTGEAEVTISQTAEHNTMRLNWRWLGSGQGSGTSTWREIPSTPVQRSRSGAYALVTRGEPSAQEILLCRISNQLPHSAGRWTLPGGGIEFGEHPEQAMCREVQEETGFTVEATGLAGIDSWVVEQNQVSFHALGYIYTARVLSGELVDELDGTTDLAAWHALGDVDSLPAVGLVHKGLNLLD